LPKLFACTGVFIWSFKWTTSDTQPGGVPECPTLCHQ
jgi:hypothetical protein